MYFKIIFETADGVLHALFLDSGTYYDGRAKVVGHFVFIAGGKGVDRWQIRQGHPVGLYVKKIRSGVDEELATINSFGRAIGSGIQKNIKVIHEAAIVWDISM